MSMKQKDHYKTGIKNVQLMKYTPIPFLKLEAQWAEPVPLTLNSALRKLDTEPSIGTSQTSCGSFS
jgi:hypothetical protein